MKLTTTLAAVALALSAALAPSTAYAEIKHVDDAVGDLDHGTDLTRVVVKHAKVVRVKLRHVDLKPHPARTAGVSVFIDARPGLPGPEYVLGSGLVDGTDYLLTVTDGFKPVNKVVDCQYQLKLDYAKDVTRIWFSRECFDRPGKVRVAVKIGAEAKGQPGDTIVDWMGKVRSFTPWVARG